MTMQDVLKKWNDVLTETSKTVVVCRALKIGEPAALRADLRAAGFVPGGKTIKYSNGDSISDRWRKPSQEASR